MASAEYLLATNSMDQLAIELQSCHSGSAGWRPPNHRNGFPVEMVSARLAARVKEGNLASGGWIWR
jgi:hypothetical protein